VYGLILHDSIYSKYFNQGLAWKPRIEDTLSVEDVTGETEGDLSSEAASLSKPEQ
jgi:hypothetical protein